jgi:hypothetical protein
LIITFSPVVINSGTSIVLPFSKIAFFILEVAPEFFGASSVSLIVRTTDSGKAIPKISSPNFCTLTCNPSVMNCFSHSILLE